MGLKTMSLLAATTVSSSGGSAQVFADDGVTIQNGLHLIVPADTDYQTRRQLTVKYRPPAVDPKTGVYGKDKKSMTYVKPLVLSTGQVIFQTVRIEREMHPSETAANAAEMNKIGAQLLSDTDTDAFWASGSMT